MTISPVRGEAELLKVLYITANWTSKILTKLTVQCAQSHPARTDLTV